jgi:hypothetical protein
MIMHLKYSGIYFAIALSIAIASSASGQTDSLSSHPMRLSAMPILMYDSDTGLGFGGKAVVKDSSRLFDLLVFGSTKGEQWYAFAYSSPDPETRQGRAGLVSIDSKIEYKKVLKSCFFGFGNNTSDNEFKFPKEFFDIQGTGAYSFSEFASGNFTIRYVHYAVYNFADDSLISRATHGTGESQLLATSLWLRLDTRDSDINPKTGIRLILGAEKALKSLGMDWNFEKYRAEFSAYHPLLGNRDIVAFRIWSQYLEGDSPYLELSYLGDGWTARGYKAGRFLDKGMTLSTIEYRFPIYKKLGGAVFADAGRVWHEFSEFSFDNWHTDFGGGLRYFLANFLVRLDIGHCNEGTGIYFNFGHVF